jgi:hypothetical protein
VTLDYTKDVKKNGVTFYRFAGTEKMFASVEENPDNCWLSYMIIVIFPFGIQLFNLYKRVLLFWWSLQSFWGHQFVNVPLWSSGFCLFSSLFLGRFFLPGSGRRIKSKN